MSEGAKLFSITRKDLRVDAFCTGGPGGQNQNRRKKGCRITHLASGAVGEGREHKSYEQNQRAAFRRMAESDVFKLWAKREASRLLGVESNARAAVERAMRPGNLRVEVRRANGTWTRDG